MINVHLSEGFGNNLFQVCFAEVVSALSGAHIRVCGVDGPVARLYEKSNDEHNSVVIRDRYSNRSQIPYKGLISNCLRTLAANKSILLKGNFEYFEIFADIQIKNTPLHVFKSNKENQDTVRVHVRLNNRLVQLNHSINWVCPNKILKYVRNLYPSSKIEIISDYNFPSSELEIDHSIIALRQECRNGPNPGALFVPKNISAEYIRNWLDAISSNEIEFTRRDKATKFRQSAGGLNNDFLDDFKVLQSSSVLIFWGSTFSYLASKFTEREIKIITISPWKNDKDKKGPFLDLDNHFDRIKFADFRYEPNNFQAKIFMNGVDKIPYFIRHYSQALISKVIS